ncbi:MULTISPECIES: 4-hydroxyphenylacetate catabolism regulator HpaA [Xanthomonas]|uniref:4-hydroxyphenylacetate catabolism regulator HpaA n=1 Tax=Xanthomonas TaxID=338 RepID=UPI00096D047A|nr:4-hydroxyphenylacetate catabolism regulator HpaA [Xanthomonas campestris]MCC5095033.1 4-hydroxyphenylacetate catabolism regulator HpaA [Xanthomonas campestris pv. incanae]MEA9612483.1 4-hydroxyphenylacetate catabolism regulator HpaA [Xanthomonas campestris pv. incanae]MEA9621208.1 4-hydroxyphenylacetate catabolism regulator HpaA [Xanthomonas campestris pv. incanae]RFF40370.1 4-hydroxyphenylacetate catabolism regulator HpaA [Xanthomonas campestris pv. incanae]WDJ11177.1 4-hydroxyphenylacetat
MIRRISPGAVPPSLPSAPGASHHHADAPQAGVQPPADTAHHAPRLRPAPPRKRRRGMRSLDGMDDELDATELEEAEAARVSALRGRVSIAVAQPQGQGQRQDDQHGEGGNAQAGDPQAGTWPIAAPSQVDDSVRASVQEVLDRYAATPAADQTIRRRALAVALVELRAIGVAHPAAAQLTTMAWRLMREHLHSGSAGAAAETLQALRKRLLDLVPAQPDTSPALRSFHLLLPLMLLNAEKPRKRLDRARAITRLNTLLIEHHDGTAQEIRA